MDSNMIATFKNARHVARDRRRPLDMRLRARTSATIARQLILESMPGLMALLGFLGIFAYGFTSVVIGAGVSPSQLMIWVASNEFIVFALTLLLAGVISVQIF